jgi:small subunit ribosomal protein S8
MDTVGNAFCTLRNAQTRGFYKVEIPFSSHIWDIMLTLYIEGFIRGCKRKASQTSANKWTSITVFLKYDLASPVFQELHRISSPGRRVYTQSKKVTKYKGGLGLFLLSTSRGVLTDRDARGWKLGGEMIGRVF